MSLGHLKKNPAFLRLKAVAVVTRSHRPDPHSRSLSNWNRAATASTCTRQWSVTQWSGSVVPLPHLHSAACVVSNDNSIHFQTFNSHLIPPLTTLHLNSGVT